MPAHELYEHQKTALARITGEARPALFMQMRMGKTPVIIRWATALPDARRFLVVGPMTILDDWQQELRLEGIRRVVRLDGRSKAERVEWLEGGAGWYLINYEGVRVSGSAITDLNWDVIIADESTAIRNPKAQITKTMIRGFAHVPYRAILTGDPAPEGPMDYFSQFLFLRGNFMNYGNYWVFRQKKFKQNPFLQWDWNPLPGTRDEIKQYVHQHAVVMTRAQWKIGGHFAPPQYRRIELNDAQRAAMQQLKKNFGYEYIQTNFATVRDVWMARVAGGFSPDQLNPELLSNAKTAELISLLRGELRHEPVVVWFRFNEELAHVVRELNKAKITAIGVTGATPRQQRMLHRNDFKAGHYQVICVQVKLGRFGWDLSHARTVVRYSHAYDLESYVQSKDRVVHPSKTDPLLEIHLVTKDTIDEDVVKALRRKHNSSKAFMREVNRAALARLTKEAHENQTKEKTRVKGTEDHSVGKVHRIYPGSGVR